MKRNYAAERREAANYADAIMNGKDLPMPFGEGPTLSAQWTAAWGLVYQAYLSGLRAALRR